MVSPGPRKAAASLTFFPRGGWKCVWEKREGYKEKNAGLFLGYTPDGGRLYDFLQNRIFRNFRVKKGEGRGQSCSSHIENEKKFFSAGFCQIWTASIRGGKISEVTAYSTLLLVRKLFFLAHSADTKLKNSTFSDCYD